MVKELALSVYPYSVHWNGTHDENSCPLDMFDPPLLGRSGLSHSMIDKDPLVVNDDVVSLAISFTTRRHA